LPNKCTQAPFAHGATGLHLSSAHPSRSAQLVLDAHISSDWQSISGNPAKLGLSLLSIAFDVVFLIQHFVLYRPPPAVARNAGEVHARGGAAGEASRSPTERDALLSSSQEV